MAYKAGEGTPQRLPNTNSHSKQFLPLTTTSMSTMLPWNPFLVCEIEVSPNGGPGSCCGMTKKRRSVQKLNQIPGYQDRPSEAEHSRQRAVRHFNSAI
jgi:hypothetical protein